MSTIPWMRNWSAATLSVCLFLCLNMPPDGIAAQDGFKDPGLVKAGEDTPNRSPIALLAEPHTAAAALEDGLQTELPERVALGLASAQRFRAVELSPQAIAPDAISVGDTLYLGLFDDVRLWATIDRVSTDINGVQAIRGRIQDSEYGTVLLSIGDGRLLAVIAIPERAQEFVISDFGDGFGHIVQDVEPGLKDVLEPGPPLLPLLDETDETRDFWPPETSAESAISAETQVTIDLMIVYTRAAREWADSQATSINHVINQAMENGQLALDNSEVGISLHLVHAAEIDYVESGDSSDDLRFITHSSEDVRLLRNTHGADLVSLFAAVEDVGGLAWTLNSQSGSPSYGFQLIRAQQAGLTYTHIHEIGHNMGAHHHKEQNYQPGPGLYPYSAGWRWTGQDGQRYCSVMTYESGSYFGDGRYHASVPYFSNPSINYQGEATGHPTDADNARTLVATKTVIADYRRTGGTCSSSTIAISPGSALDETLATTDCISRQRPGDTYYDTFTFDATAGTTYTIELRSSDFDGYLYLLNTAGDVLAQDDDSGEGLNATMIYTPAVSETLLMHATSYSAGATGAYTVALSGAVIPATPTGLTAMAVSPWTVNLSWRDNSNNESGFRIERRTGSGAWSRIATVGADETAYSDSGLNSVTAYTYRIRAYTGSGNSVYSNVANAHTCVPISEIGVGTSVNGALQTTDCYSLKRLGGHFRDTYAFAATAGTTYTITLSSSRFNTYLYLLNPATQVLAENDDRDDETTNSRILYTPAVSETLRIQITTYRPGETGAYAMSLAADPGTTTPATPSALTAAAASTSRIDLSWRDNSGNESGFRIERKTGSGSWSQIDTVGANVTAFADTGLSASTTFTYRVRAYNLGGASAYSNETSADTQGEPPAAPASLTAKAMTTSRVDLRWRDRSDDESGFRIDRKTGSGKWSRVAEVGADVTRFSDTRLNPEITYAFRVRALNAAGTSGPSNVAKTTTAAPAAPSQLTAIALPGSRLTLNWRDKSNNETAFRIYRKIESGAWSQIAKVGADATAFVDTGLRSSTAYLYRVRAVNAIGKSRYSKAASAATP